MNIRVLVEDEALLAIDIAGHLTDAGFSVIGPAASGTKALALIKENGCDIAVLDVNLRDETSEPIAELRTNGTLLSFCRGFRVNSRQIGSNACCCFQSRSARLFL